MSRHIVQGSKFCAKNLILFYLVSLQHLPYGLTARIAGFHPAGPGSTPGMGNIFIKIDSKKILLYLLPKINMSLTYLPKYHKAIPAKTRL